jgi:hypothetical protein
MTEIEKPTTTSLMLEGFEMGAVSAAVEKAAEQLVAKLGIKPDNVMAIQVAKFTIVLSAKHMALPMMPDTMDRKPFVERRVDMAIKGVTTTASHETLSSFMEILGPMMQTLAEDGPALFSAVASLSEDTTKTKTARKARR